MDFENCFHSTSSILMEGALGERLKREYHITFDENVAMAGLVYDEAAKNALEKIWCEYIEISKKYNLPFMATTPTRRANQERVEMSPFSKKIIKDNVDLLKQIKSAYYNNMYIGGLMGCKGDAYKATDVLSVEESKLFHSWQANLFKESGVDYLFAGIMPALPEAIGIAQAMEQTELPYIISFMIRKDGKLIDGTTLHDAIKEIDGQTKQNPICYMTNCVHPLVLKEALLQSFNQTQLVKKRFHGIQANTSPLSPEELDNCCDLHTSDCNSLADDMIDLRNCIDMKIYGGCCGTDHTHMEQIAKRICI